MQKWEYLVFAFEWANDALRPRRINGNEPKDWKKGPTMYEFANQIGEEGWELVAAYEFSDLPGLIFKRPKE